VASSEKYIHFLSVMFDVAQLPNSPYIDSLSQGNDTGYGAGFNRAYFRTDKETASIDSSLLLKLHGDKKIP
jgi:hypothetical protein